MRQRSSKSRSGVLAFPGLPEQSAKDRLHVAFVTPEMVPYVKTGGLADVSAALPKALCRLGHQVTVVLPRFRQIAVLKTE